MKVISTLMFIFISLASFSQVGDAVKNEQWPEVGIVNVPLVGYSVKLVKHPVDNIYVLYYQDRTYKKIREVKSITFTASIEDLSKLQKNWETAFDLGKKETISMTLGEKELIIGKYMGSLAIHVNNGGWFWLAKSELKKLFGNKD